MSRPAAGSESQLRHAAWLFLGLVAAALPFPAHAGEPKTRPNIVLILADDKD